MLIINTILTLILNIAPCENVSILNGIDNKPFSIGANIHYMREKLCGIYKITSPTNKIYIGQSINIHHRKGVYKRCNCKNQHKIYNSIKKHGWDKHKFEILQLCDYSEINDLEKYYIALYQSNKTEFGLNLREGGKNHFGNVPLKTKEWREKLSKRMLGNRYRAGKRTDKERKEQGEHQKRLGMKPTLKTMQLANKARERKINQYTLDGQFIREFKSIIIAIDELNLRWGTINECLAGTLYSAHGYRWKYADTKTILLTQPLNNNLYESCKSEIIENHGIKILRVNHHTAFYQKVAELYAEKILNNYIKNKQNNENRNA